MDRAVLVRIATCSLLACGPHGFAAAPQDPSSYTVFAIEQLAYDDNLYRLPAGADIASVVGAGATRQDVINSVSLGTDDHWYYRDQEVDLHARVDANHFFDNQGLNNTSGQANVAWDWQFGYKLWGQVGADYVRALASFANTNYYARNLVDRADYLANARFALASRWTLYGGFTGAATSLSAAPQAIYDFRSKAGNVGLEYASAADNSVSFEYRYTDAHFPNAFVLNGAPFNPDYDEDLALFTVKYAFTAVTQLQLGAGYLRRSYPFSQFAAFSGSIGHASLQWQPADALQIVVTGRHDLRAYVDSESDYFVSNGGSIEPTWKPSDLLALSFAATYEKHNYIDSSPSAITFVSRHDKVMTQQAKVVYKPRQFLTVTLTYLYTRRDSNQAVLAFDDQFATANFTFKF